jgi:NAD(P)-dependent dehydrogenase (short-subunit alcohol dehydrogenase family)
MRQVALVTGSSRGIGFATADALAQEGFAIALNGPADDDELRAAHVALQKRGAPVFSAAFDVSDLTQHATQLEAIEKALGPLTTLVNNAGVGVLKRGDLLEVTEASWDRCLTINTKAMFFLSQAFAKRLLARERQKDLFYSIVNVTSSNANAVAVQRAEYCASKAAAAMVSKALAVRLGSENIAVYDIQPGLIATDMTAPVIESYKKRAEEGLTLFPRVGQPEEIGKIIATLASGKLPYTTGQAIAADGGLLLPRF